MKFGVSQTASLSYFDYFLNIFPFQVPPNTWSTAVYKLCLAENVGVLSKKKYETSLLITITNIGLDKLCESKFVETYSEHL